MVPPERWRTTLTRYLGAVVVIALATVLRFWFDEPLAGGGFMFFFAAVIVASWFGGLGPSLVALILSMLVCEQFFEPAPDAPPDPPVRAMAGMGLFFFTGLTTAALSESLRRARRRAEAADRRKDEFLAILAHELRNPLAPITMALEVARRSYEDEATLCWAHEMMERQTRHLVRLVDDLLDVSRIARNKIELRTEAIEIRQVVERAIEAARSVVDGKRHELTVVLPDEPLLVVVDPVRLAQVTANLLNNAAKYTPPGGQIWLTVDRAGTEVELRVRDTGIGIAPETLPNVFDLFVQAPAVSGEGGLGIGLTLVKSLAALMGGTVEARSEGLGKGSEFSLRLPIAAVEGDSFADRPQAAAGDAMIVKRHIFVVDDNRDAAESLSELLRRDGHAVRTFFDAPSLLDAVDTDVPEVVMLDLGMSEMDGVELACRLRGSPATSGALLIAITGWGQPADRARTKQAGIDHHLVKPVDASSLRALLADAPSCGV